MGAKNKNLGTAKVKKDDEFYTRLEDIEAELRFYKSHFADKIIYCNCDDPNWSSFHKYFTLNFKHLGIRKLITTHYSKDVKADYAYQEECTMGADGVLKIVRTTLNENGDFRSQECIDLLKQADIVCTNPPFSLFREYVAQLMEYKKKFLIIGSQNATTYKETFELIKTNAIWLGISYPKEFSTPSKKIKKFGNICWYTNLTHSKRKEKIELWKNYSSTDYPMYDNYNAIEVSKVSNIPLDYEEVMGVPITFLGKYNPTQFEIMGLDRYIDGNKTPNKRFTLAGNEVYARIVIKKKVQTRYREKINYGT